MRIRPCFVPASSWLFDSNHRRFFLCNLLTPIARRPNTRALKKGAAIGADFALPACLVAVANNRIAFPSFRDEMSRQRKRTMTKALFGRPNRCRTRTRWQKCGRSADARIGHHSPRNVVGRLRGRSYQAEPDCARQRANKQIRAAFPLSGGSGPPQSVNHVSQSPSTARREQAAPARPWPGAAFRVL
jgi:hypothetical protein